MPKFLFLMGLFLWVWASFLRSSEGVMSKLRTEGQEGAGCKSRMFWTMKLEWKRAWPGDTGLQSRTNLQHRNVKVCREEYVSLLKEGCKQKQWMGWLKHTSYAHWCIFKKVSLCLFWVERMRPGQRECHGLALGSGQIGVVGGKELGIWRQNQYEDRETGLWQWKEACIASPTLGPSCVYCAFPLPITVTYQKKAIVKLLLGTSAQITFFDIQWLKPTKRF